MPEGGPPGNCGKVGAEFMYNQDPVQKKWLIDRMESSRNRASRVICGLVADRLLVPLLTRALFLQCEGVLKRPEQLKASGLRYLVAPSSRTPTIFVSRRL